MDEDERGLMIRAGLTSINGDALDGSEMRLASAFARHRKHIKAREISIQFGPRKKLIFLVRERP